ncbi:hypothetical protein IFM89_021565 [Coptis chinensis]|uniref:Uncharacterized protein n=1 Tax=Coptis chinensis TaxID=261450 RepID=A0A835M8X2_9MAGN|nr:hypothetical protein IFM89_021565 [Coptis chinensis]
MVFNVSYNSLEDLIPQTPNLQKFSDDSYSHNLELCGKPLNNTCPPPNISPPPAVPPLPLSPSKSTKLSIWTIVLIAVSAALLPFIAMIAFLCYFRKINVLQGDREDVSDEEKVQNATKRGSDPERRVELEFFDKERPMFDLDDLLRASAEMMRKRKMGSTYKVTIDSGPIVVVKRFKEMSDLDKKEFDFADAFQSFHVGCKQGQELSTPFDKRKSHPATSTTSEYGVSKKELLKACFSREWLLMKRNSFVYIFKMMQTWYTMGS